MMHHTILAFKPSIVAVGPISNLTLERDETEVKPTLMRLIDVLKSEQITAVFTSLTTSAPEDSEAEELDFVVAQETLRSETKRHDTHALAESRKNSNAASSQPKKKR